MVGVLADKAPSIVPTTRRSSAGTVLVIHNDGCLRIGTVPLAVPWFGRTVLKVRSLAAE